MIWDFLLFGINQFVSIVNIIYIPVKNAGEKSEQLKNKHTLKQSGELFQFLLKIFDITRV